MTNFSQPSLAALASQIVDKRIRARSVITEEGKRTKAALYLVREGRVEVKSEDGRFNNVIEAGGYFGEDMLELDVGGLKKESDIIAKYTATILDEDVVVGVLTIDECRSIIDTTAIGSSKAPEPITYEDTAIPLDSLKKHGILGAGTFGQVWLVSKEASNG